MCCELGILRIPTLPKSYLVIIFFAIGLSDVSFLLVKMFFLKNNCRKRILSVWTICTKESMEPIPEPWETMLAFGYPNMKNMEPFHHLSRGSRKKTIGLWETP